MSAPPNPGSPKGASPPPARKLRQIWREEPATAPASPKQRREQAIFQILVAMLALVGAIGGLLFLLSPVPRPSFLPLEVVNYRSALMPVLSQGYADRIAMREENLFPRTLPDAYASQDRIFLVKDLGGLARLPAKDTVVVYLSGWACTAGEDGVYIYSGDTNPDVPASRLPLRQALQALQECPAHAKLLILDIMQPLAAWMGPATPPGRLGILIDDVAGRIEAELAAVDDPHLLVLCGCSPGQVTHATQALGRSVFSYYVDDGLRGWAEVHAPATHRDGRVDVADLARYVIGRVDRWTWRNLGVRQTPILYGTGPNFPLMSLSRGQAQPRLNSPPAPSYPAWLADDWKLLDQWHAKGYYSRAPRHYRQLEAHVFRTERRWRSGADAEQLRQLRQTYINLTVREMNQALEAVPVPAAHSLALARAQGQQPDAAVTQALQAMLTQVAEQTRGLPAAKALPIQDKLTQDFLSKHKDTSAYDLASAVLAAALNETQLGPSHIRLLVGLLSTAAPEPRYVETAFLRRLARLAEQTGDRAFPSSVVPLALQVVARGERAATSYRSFAWVRGLLAQAAQARHDGEVLLLASGYASATDADLRLHQAADLYDAVLAYQGIILRAQEARDQAFRLLPTYTAFVQQMPYLESAWTAAVTAAEALDRTLARQPAPNAPLTNEELHRVTAGLQEQTAILRERLAPLRRPFEEDVIRRLLTQSKRETAGPDVVRELKARLTICSLPAKTRIAAWQAALELEQRLQQQILQLDEDGVTPLDTDFPPADREGWERGERDRAALRSRMALALFRLAGLRPSVRDALEKAHSAAFQTKAPADAIYRLGGQIQQAWTDAMMEQLRNERDPFAADRLSAIYPPYDFWPRADEPGLRPRPFILSAEARSLWEWLAARSAYDGRDLFGNSLNFQAARDEALASGVPLPPTPNVEISGCTEAPRLDPTQRVAQCTLRLRFRQLPESAESAQLAILTADSDWLQITPGISAPGVGPAGPWPLALDKDNPATEREVAMRIALKPGAELAAAPPPRGFLVQVKVAGYAFHYLVPVNVSLAPSHPEIVLSADPEKGADPLGDLRLRPTGVPQPFYLYVRNPTEKAQTVIVELTAGGVALGGAANKFLVPGQSIQRVAFAGLPAPPPQPAPSPPAAALPIAAPAMLPELTGPLQIRIRDAADPSKIFDSREVHVQVAAPREYVEVAAIGFDPASMANGGVNQLSARLRGRRPLAPPPCNIELVLPPARIPGFLGAKVGTFRGVLPADGKKELRLFAANLQFAEGSTDQGIIYLNVDTFARAFIYRTTFARQGETTTPQEDYQPALRLRAAPFHQADAQFVAHVEVDNPPANTTLEVALGRQVGGRFQTDLLRTFAEPRQRRIGFSPTSPTGALLFDAVVRDWAVTLDATLIIGPRLLRARLLDRTGDVVKEVLLPVTLANRPPGDVSFLGVPPLAVRGASLPVQAMGFDSQSGVKQVNFFVGKPVAGKVPPNTATTPGTPVNGNKGVWSAQLPIPATAAGPTDLGVEFINGAGLSTFGSTTVNIVEKLPPGFGTVRGTVREGDLLQPNVEVVLRDERAQALALAPPKTPPADKGIEQKAKTGPDGSFVFEKVPPGKYTLTATKPSSGRVGQQPVTVEAGKTATVAMTLFLK